MQRLEDKLTGWAANKWGQHLSFWGLSYYVLLRLFAYEIPPSRANRSGGWERSKFHVKAGDSLY